ncbi:MAG TPA: FKBP-type peptidyl-prolyl cis-trans isomerase [Treponemataceae bacterium]|jgi:FKBP-type peptidyl-prolyl cis-trans isomerase FkpA|nr:MAG: putative FKBP-type peptidyl-prolyl cis-trans isomerase FkpA precursor [Spirochaetes bacterium ADurb.Bin269]HOC30043.1 FKBP-type peptidyl-prolyl cis-trans isomerase [Treponemataceae bacterium]HPX47284.1 FKBP-type peptidyl-prolyl cis-trans isomerase [Treponemataceae bacterium]
MKKIALFALAAATLFAVSCKKNDASATADANDASYAFGMALGSSLKETQVAIDYDKMLKGIKDIVEGKETEITLEEAGMRIQAAISQAQALASESNSKKEAEFLESNGKKAGIVTTESGLQYEVLKEGTGAHPKASDTVKVDYVGTLLDGTKFDSSIDRGQPAEFPLDGVIPGWTEGIQLMKVGGKTRFYIPSNLAYGQSGAGGVIGPNSTLVFEVDLLDIVQ